MTLWKRLLWESGVCGTVCKLYIYVTGVTSRLLGGDED